MTQAGVKIGRRRVGAGAQKRVTRENPARSYGRSNVTNEPANKHRCDVMMEIAEGRSAGALLENGFLDFCLEEGLQLHILTPGSTFPPFVDRYARDGVRFSYLPVHRYSSITRLGILERRIGNLLLRKHLPGARRLLWKMAGERFAAKLAGDLGESLRRERPDLFVSTTVTDGFDLGMVAASRRLGIPTLGNVFSWDHPFRGQAARPDVVTCWSDFVKDALVERQAYEPHQVKVVGAPALDPYFRSDCAWSRERLCEAVGLDPSRPILVFASLGQLRMFLDETGSFRALMAAIDQGRIRGDPQVVLRLHPMSRTVYFGEYCRRPDVAVSRFEGYCPGMRWWPAFDEVVLAANILRHADVCVSPGSTVTIETAIYDVPTIIPTFNPYAPEEYRDYFSRFWLEGHFRLIAENGLLPIVESIDELVDAVNKALEDREWTARGQKSIRDRIIGPQDGLSTRRFAQAVIEAARGRLGLRGVEEVATN